MSVFSFSTVRSKMVDVLFYMMPRMLRVRFQKLLWGGLYGKNWHNFHEKTRCTQAGVPKGWENRKACFDELFTLLKKRGGSVKLIDYGCGNGMFTGYIGSIIGDKDIVVGYDLNSEVIENNKKQHLNIEFTSENPFERLPSRLDTLVLYMGSTLAYIEMDEFNHILNEAQNYASKVYVVVSDTVKGNIPASYSNRGTFAYNYNLQWVFLRNEIDILFHQINDDGYYKFQQIVGEL